jgi:hypothetical protein
MVFCGRGPSVLNSQSCPASDDRSAPPYALVRETTVFTGQLDPLASVFVLWDGMEGRYC